MGSGVVRDVSASLGCGMMCRCEGENWADRHEHSRSRVSQVRACEALSWAWGVSSVVGRAC
jgi:hypothetical protein